MRMSLKEVRQLETGSNFSSAKDNIIAFPIKAGTNPMEHVLTCKAAHCGVMVVCKSFA